MLDDASSNFHWLKLKNVLAIFLPRIRRLWANRLAFVQKSQLFLLIISVVLKVWQFIYAISAVFPSKIIWTCMWNVSSKLHPFFFVLLSHHISCHAPLFDIPFGLLSFISLENRSWNIIFSLCRSLNKHKKEWVQNGDTVC